LPTHLHLHKEEELNSRVSWVSA